MSLLPSTDRILSDPVQSVTSPRVMRAIAAPTISHLDGASSSPRLIVLLLGALERALAAQGRCATV
jgi:hypothetical protein